ncbi:hypothetical protein [Rhodococcus sp. Leaf233]|uniref:hypothetical protein n=1 Tax=Rhodococcus sp. Leaf233 TaxID=1736302 RepID=UPI00070C12E2|nr:hypothetical protein [Rhodococcus sp. Leaf233]KQU33571.1 hypothetical protein ASH04_06985 [Rhodococcus sp. Leaf233]
MTSSSRIEVFGADGSYWCVHGKGAGEQGVYLGQDQVKGLMDSVVRQTWKSGARQVGGTLEGMWIDVRDLMLGFHVKEVGNTPVDVIVSKFRKAFQYKLDRWDPEAKLARIAYTTELSGTRSLDVQLYEGSDFDPGTDILVAGHANPILPLRAGQPMWYWDSVVSNWSTTGTSGSGLVGGTAAKGPKPSNPTDQEMPARWVLTRGQWTIPDNSWRGAPYKRAPGPDLASGLDHTTRTILTPLITSTDEGAVITTDSSRELMIRSSAGTNLLGRMPVPGKYFTYWWPPYTPEQNITVSVTNAPAGGAMAMFIARRYSEWPWGLE